MAKKWGSNGRWKGILRPYSPEDVDRLRGSVQVEHTFARLGAERLWELLQKEKYIAALGALTGHQAVQQVKAGLKAVYCSGWQVAADGNAAFQTYPDQSLYPAHSVPNLVRRINAALQRADQIHHAKEKKQASSTAPYWFAPIVADAEAGFGGALNAFELMKDMIDAGAAGVHFEDQLSSAKKCGHLGGKVLVPTGEFIQKLLSARLAADVEGVPALIIARTDANGARLLTSDVDERDKRFLTGERTVEGFFGFKGGLDACIARALEYAPYADMLWFETSEPNLAEARKFAEAVHRRFPEKLFAYNCSPSFNWKLKLDEAAISKFQGELGAMGYRFQFVTLAGFHSLNYSMFNLAKAYAARGMSAYADFQEEEIKGEVNGYEAFKHQDFVGTGYFDQVAMIISNGQISTLALKGSTEEEQFAVS